MKTTFKEELINEIAGITNFDEKKIKAALKQVWMNTPNVKIGVQGDGTIREGVKVSGWKGYGDEKAWIKIPTPWFAPLVKWCKDNGIGCQRTKTVANCFVLKLL